MPARRRRIIRHRPRPRLKARPPRRRGVFGVSPRRTPVPFLTRLAGQHAGTICIKGSALRCPFLPPGIPPTGNDPFMQDRLPQSRSDAVLQARTGHIAVLRELLPYIWPADRPDLRWRVVLALGALIIAKAITL